VTGQAATGILRGRRQRDERPNDMAISQQVRDLIANAWPDLCPCLVGTVGKNGPQISPKSSVRVFDDEHLAYWERSKRTALENLRHDDRVVIYYANFRGIGAGTSNRPILYRFHGTAQLIESGEIRDRIFANMSEFERTHVGADQGIAVLVKIDRVVDVVGRPVSLG
jgi:hypothetical protein